MSPNSQKNKKPLKLHHQKVDALVRVIANIQILFIFHSPTALIVPDLISLEDFGEDACKHAWLVSFTVT